MMLNALTIDVEDYFQVTAFEGQVQRRHWDQYPSRVVANTRRLLQLLERHQVRATFFMLGWVAHRFPELVQEIARAGHEVGCHSYWHRLIYRLTPDEFQEDLKLARCVIEQALGGPVTTYRAPSYSITRQSLWALQILSADGFHSDSSIFPIYHDRYGIPDADPFPHRVPGVPNELWEFPPSVFRFWKMNLPISGGGYFRLYPVQWTAYMLRQINQGGQPFVFYLHPWEIDPAQPRLPGAGWSRWRHYLNLSSTQRKLDWLLSQFQFDTMSAALAAVRQLAPQATNQEPPSRAEGGRLHDSARYSLPRPSVSLSAR